MFCIIGDFNNSQTAETSSQHLQSSKFSSRTSERLQTGSHTRRLISATYKSIPAGAAENFLSFAERQSVSIILDDLQFIVDHYCFAKAVNTKSVTERRQAWGYTRKQVTGAYKLHIQHSISKLQVKSSNQLHA